MLVPGAFSMFAGRLWKPSVQHDGVDGFHQVHHSAAGDQADGLSIHHCQAVGAVVAVEVDGNGGGALQVQVDRQADLLLLGGSLTGEAVRASSAVCRSAMSSSSS